jgi:hypothetical protein
MWKSYPFMVQRVDALRYMALDKYGGRLLVEYNAKILVRLRG